MATVLTRDAAAAACFERELRAGLAWVNTPQLIFPQLCWGGLGASGIGRELGLEGLRALPGAAPRGVRCTELSFRFHPP